jgi:hypothetical protein
MISSPLELIWYMMCVSLLLLQNEREPSGNSCVHVVRAHAVAIAARSASPRIKEGVASEDDDLTMG